MTKPTFFFRTDTLLDSGVTITNGTSTIWATPHFINLPALLEGDVLQVTADVEVRNDQSYTIEVVSQLVLAPNWTSNGVDVDPNGAVVAATLGTNILYTASGTTHYEVPVRATQYQITAADAAHFATSAVIQYRIRSRSTAVVGAPVAPFVVSGHLALSIWR